MSRPLTYGTLVIALVQCSGVAGIKSFRSSEAGLRPGFVSTPLDRKTRPIIVKSRPRPCFRDGPNGKRWSSLFASSPEKDEPEFLDAEFVDSGDVYDSKSLEDAIGSLFQLSQGGQSSSSSISSRPKSRNTRATASTLESSVLDAGPSDWMKPHDLGEQRELPEDTFQENPPMADGETMADVNNDWQQPSPASESSPSAASSGVSMDEGGVFLDPELYTRTRDLLNPDGSLNLSGDAGTYGRQQQRMGQNDPDREAYDTLTEQIIVPNPRIPDESADDDSLMDNVADMERLLKENARRQASQQPSTAESEELHRRVFENEEGFLKQSEAFKESLSNGKDGREATAQKRADEYRHRQKESVRILEEQLKEIKENAPSRDEVPNIPTVPTADIDSSESKSNRNSEPPELSTSNAIETCQSCECILRSDEVQHARDAFKSSGKEQLLCRVCHADQLQSKRPVSPPGGAYDNGMTNKGSSFYNSRDGRERSNARGPAGRESFPGRQTTQNRVPPKTKIAPQSPNPPQSREIESLTHRTQYLERELKKEKKRAETAERDVNSLRAVIRGLEDALNAALVTKYNDPNTKAEENFETPNVDHDDSSGTDEENVVMDANGDRWVQIVDPDTGDIFYLNEETNEMKWEI